MTRLLALLLVVSTVALGPPARPGAQGPPVPLQFLGQAIVPTGTTFAGTTVGGLSSITWDPQRERLLRDLRRPEPVPAGALLHAPARRRGRAADDGDVAFTGVTTLLAPNGLPYAPFSLDPEGLASRRTGSSWSPRKASPTPDRPFLRRYSLDGTFLVAAGAPARSCRRPTTRAASGRISRSRARQCRRTATSSSRARRTRSSRTARRRRSRTAARRGSSATTSRPGGSTASGSTRPTRWRSRPCRRQVLGQRPRRAAAAQQRVPDRDGALVLGRRRRAPATRSSSTRSRSRARRTSTASRASPGARTGPAGEEDAALRPATRSGSRSTTSRG